MRAASIASREAMSASSTTRTRAISNARTRSSRPIRLASVDSRATIAATSSARLRSISNFRVDSSALIRSAASV